MAVPAVFELLAEKSLVPSERVGDAQAVMATGRIFGPILGGLALGAGSYERLSVVGTSVIVVGAVTVSIIETYRSRETRNIEG
jgi:predicted MFS family arabinose efflux permease